MNALARTCELELLERLLEEGGPPALLAALDEALAATPDGTRVTLEGGLLVGREALEAIRAAVELDRAHLERHPEALFQCLWNRLWWHDAPEAAAFYADPARGPWAGQGPKLSALAERWRAAKEAAGAVWLRSRRPPAEPLSAAGAVQVLRGNDRPVEAMAVSADGRLLAAAAGGQVCVWDLARGALWRRLDLEEAGDIRGVAFSPDGRHLATGTRDHTARLWDLETESELWAAGGHEGQVTAVAFSPDGARLAVGNLGWTARVYDLQGAELAVFEGHRQSVLSVAWAPDGRVVVSAGSDGTAQVWDPASGRRLALLGDPDLVAEVEAAERDVSVMGDTVEGLGFSRDGTRLAASLGQGVRVWDTRDWREVATVSPDGRPISWLDDGRLAVAAWESLDVWADLGAAEPALRETIDPRRDRDAMTAFLPDGRVARSSRDGLVRVRALGAPADQGPRLAERDLQLCGLFADPRSARALTCAGEHALRFGLLDLDSARQVELPALPERAVDRFPEPMVCPAALRLLAEAREGDERQWAVWDLAAGIRLATLRSGELGPPAAGESQFATTRMLFHPDGRRVLVSRHRRVGVWDGATGARAGLLEWGEGEQEIEELALAGEGRLLLTRERSLGWNTEGRVAIWSLESGQRLAEALVGTGGLAALAVRADGRLAASARLDGKLYLWPLAAEEAGGLMFGRSEARALAFSPDGAWLAAAESEGGLRVWDVARREERRLLSPSAGPIRALAWGPGGLVASGWGHTRVFDPDTGQVLRQLPEVDPRTVLEPVWAVAQEDGCAVYRAYGEGPLALLPGRLEQACFVGGDLLVGVEASSRLPAVHQLVGAGGPAARTPWSEPPLVRFGRADAPPPSPPPPRRLGPSAPPLKGSRRDPPKPRGFTRF